MLHTHGQHTHPQQAGAIIGLIFLSHVGAKMLGYYTGFFPRVTPYACVQSYATLPTCLIESHTQMYYVSMASIHILNKQVLLYIFLSHVGAKMLGYYIHGVLSLCHPICMCSVTCHPAHMPLNREPHAHVLCIHGHHIFKDIFIIINFMSLYKIIIISHFCLLVCIHSPQSHCAIVYTMHSYSPVSFLPLHRA